MKRAPKLDRPGETVAFGGVFLRVAMVDLGVTGAEVAALCGVTERTVNRWLSEEQPLPVLVRRVLRAAMLGLLSRKALERL